MKEAGHLIRLAGVFVAGFLLFLLLRQQLVPAGFGKYGHFRAGALDDNRSRAIVFAGRGACADCHDEQAKTLAGAAHAKVGCEACHGPLAGHAADPSIAPTLPDSGKLCARCHEADSAKPKGFPQVVSQEHSGGEVCKSCHQPHRPRIQ